MMVLSGHSIRAVSVGGIDTCIELPSFKLCFDIGHCPPTAIAHERVLFTHAHSDHMGGVVHHVCTRDMMGMRPPHYYLPAENLEAFEQMLAAWRRLDRSELPCHLHAVSPGDEFDIGKGRIVRAFRALHRVPCIGYAICSTKSKLKEELANKTGAELQALRASGVAITNTTDTVEVAFCGDTLPDVIEREPLVRTARVLILECTFLDEQVPVESARKMGHIHLDEILERADLFENEHILLTHFSARYSSQQIRDILDKRLPQSLRGRVVPNLAGHPR